MILQFYNLFTSLQNPLLQLYITPIGQHTHHFYLRRIHLYRKTSLNHLLRSCLTLMFIFSRRNASNKSHSGSIAYVYAFVITLKSNLFISTCSDETAQMVSHYDRSYDTVSCRRSQRGLDVDGMSHYLFI